MQKVDIIDAHVDDLKKYFITGWVEAHSLPGELLFVQANKIVGKTYPWIRRKDLDDLYDPSEKLDYHCVFKNSVNDDDGISTFDTNCSRYGLTRIAPYFEADDLSNINDGISVPILSPDLTYKSDRLRVLNAIAKDGHFSK